MFWWNEVNNNDVHRVSISCKIYYIDVDKILYSVTEREIDRIHVIFLYFIRLKNRINL